MDRTRFSIVDKAEPRQDVLPPRPKVLRHARQTKGSFSTAELLPSLSKLAAHVGLSDFYEVALEMIGGLVHCDRRLVMRYSRFDRPSFIVNQSLPGDYVTSYLEGLYRFDPLYRIVRSRETAGVLTFQGLREDQPVDSFYDEFFASVMIHDELSMMLPAVSGVCIALCFDRNRQSFQAAEVFRLHQLYSLIDSLHRLHIERTMFGSRCGSPFDSKMAILITDADGHALFNNGKWPVIDQRAGVPDLTSLTRASPSGVHVLDADHVLHWEMLPTSNALAPGGRIHIIERMSAGCVNVNVEQIFGVFAYRYRLTPRETDIVRLMLRGYPSSTIASRLGLSAGTVKNHRYRLYTKLDITTEREIFSLFLNDILSNN
jgi:DNA-binding CsgD family transcriptional regulator